MKYNIIKKTLNLNLQIKEIKLNLWNILIKAKFVVIF